MITHRYFNREQKEMPFLCDGLEADIMCLKKQN